MKFNRIDISIDKACNENFDNFQKTNNGGFCDKCQKGVQDFTKMNNEQLFQFFSQSNESICGKFRLDQLGSLYPQKANNNKGKFPLIAAASVGLLTLLLPKDSNASITSEKIQQNITVSSSNLKSFVKVQTANDTLVTIKGKITSIENRIGIPGANIHIKGTEIGTVANIDGEFSITISHELNKNLTVIFSFVGLATEEREISIENPEIDLGEIQMMANVTQLGEVCVSRWSPRGIWYSISSIFRK